MYGACTNATDTTDAGITKQYARLIQPNASPTNATVPNDSVDAATATGRKNTYGIAPDTAQSAVSVAASVIERVFIFMFTSIGLRAYRDSP